MSKKRNVVFSNFKYFLAYISVFNNKRYSIASFEIWIRLDNYKPVLLDKGTLFMYFFLNFSLIMAGRSGFCYITRINSMINCGTWFRLEKTTIYSNIKFLLILLFRASVGCVEKFSNN